MKAACRFWSVGPRVHGGKEMCGKMTELGAPAPPWAPEKLTPICAECADNLNYVTRPL